MTEKAADRWFKAFNDRDCEAIAALGPERKQQQLYQGVGDACRAVYKDQDGLWPAAETALRQVGGYPADCLDRLAFQLLHDLVTAHQRAPNAEIRIVDPPPGEDCDSDNSSALTTSGVQSRVPVFRRFRSPNRADRTGPTTGPRQRR